ncbi:interferon alpha-17-like [Brachionichthys hirsutus]|uniref:interferon alpha-17-like n=1 Tax=Brachionichthys hirsutus TaxID=412623 RepID=UPI003604F555
MMLLSLLLIVPLTVVAMPTCRVQGDLVRSAHHLLRDLGGDFPVRCLKYNTNISIPDSAFPAATANQTQCHRALWVLHESLSEAGTVFDDYEIPVEEGGVTWDEKKLEDFQNLQYRLLKEGACLTRVDGSGVLPSYFRNVTSLLQQEDIASCGWTILKRDLLRVLMFMLQNHHGCFVWRNVQ